jgi:hypothetical protein
VYGQIEMTLAELRRGAGSQYLFHYTDAVGADLAIDDGRFEQTSDPYQWLLSTPKLAPFVIPEIYVAAAIWTGRVWRLSDD